MDVLHLDFESRSEIELQRAGLWNYLLGDETALYCAGFAFGKEDPRLLEFSRDGKSITGPDQSRIKEHVAGGGKVVAHNAQFEFWLWNKILVPRYGFPRLHIRQVICTMARALSMGLPAALENVAPALGLPFEKDQRGHALMLRLCRPQRGSPKWLIDRPEFTFLGEKITPEQALRELGEYCRQDVKVERGVYERTLPLSARQHRVWCMDQRINARGLRFDMPAVKGGLEIRDTALEKIGEELAQITDGVVAAGSALPAMKEWLKERGHEMESANKEAINFKLAEPDVPDDVRRVLELRQEANRATSAAKLDTMDRQSDANGRVRFAYRFHGPHTGRWASLSLQLHNFPRDLPKPGTVELAMELVGESNYEAVDMIFGPPLATVSKLLRGFIVSDDDKLLIGGDWANVEGRMAAWLAGADWKLEAFRKADAGEAFDIYVQSYSKSFGVAPEDVDDHQRQVGKVQELSWQYQGAVGAYLSMASNYGVEPPSEDEIVHMVRSWRLVNHEIVDTWYALERAAINAVINKGKTVPVSRVAFRTVGSFLMCRLPSGRVMCYPYPRVVIVEGRQRLTYKTVPSPDLWKQGLVHPGSTRSWARVDTYGGKLFENITQAACADILSGAMLRLEADNLPVVMHTHDEPVSEIKGANGETLRRFHKILNTPEDWAKEIPLVAECWIGHRYQK